MAFDTKVRKLWAILAIPAVLLAIGTGYERGGLAGLRDLTTDTLHSVGLYQNAPRDTANAPLHAPATSKPAATLAADEVFWLTIKDSRAPGLFDEFLKKFPDSPHAQEAHAKLEELAKAQQPAVQQQPRAPIRGPGMMMSPGGGG
jgi:hypothetical protein